MNKVKAFVKLIRPVNCVMMGFAVIVGAALAGKETILEQFPNLLFGFSTGFFLTGAAMVVNDYYDKETDAVNEPTRPIPSGAVSPNEALTLALGFVFVGFLSAFLTNPVPNWQCLFVALLSWIIVLVYVTKGKSTGLPGNFLVSTCIAVPFIYGSFTIGRGLVSTIGIFVAMVFLSNTGREVTKGIVDVEGDRESNVRTVAVLFGEQRASVVAFVFYLSAVALSPMPWLLGIVSFWYIPFVVLTDMGLILNSTLLLLNPSRENARKIKNRNMLWFFSGLLAFLTGA